MYGLFTSICKPEPEDLVLDLGVTPDERLGDSNFFEKLYPWKAQIVAASIEDCTNITEKYKLKGFVPITPHQPLPFRDGEFDILFCSAVLEHVGTRKDQELFLSECLRIADRVFLTTPNRWFPVEMHTFMPFLHWLPWSWFQEIISPIHGGFWADINNLNLLSKKDVPGLSDEVQVNYVRMLGMPSNLVITRKTGR